MSSLKNKSRDISIAFIGIAILILINILGSYIYKRFDLTAEKRFTLNEATTSLLDSLDDVVYLKIYLEGEFQPEIAKLRNETKELLEIYRSYAPGKIEYTFIDPMTIGTKEESMELQKQLFKKGIEPKEIPNKDKNGTMSAQVIFPGAIVTYKGQESVCNFFKRQMGQELDADISNSVEELEYELTNAIYKLNIKSGKRRVAILQGHGELDSLETTDLSKALRDYYEVGYVTLNGKLGALNDYGTLIVAQPDSAFNDKDLFVIDQFIMRGGKALWLIDNVEPFVDSLKMYGQSVGLDKNLNLNEMLFKYGVRINNNLINDNERSGFIPGIASRTSNAQVKVLPWIFSPVMISGSSHPIVKNLDGVKFDYVSSMDTVAAKGIEKTVIGSTSRTTRVLSTPARIQVGIAFKKIPDQVFNSGIQNIAILLEGGFTSVYKNRLPAAIVKDSVINFKGDGVASKMIVVSDGDVAKNEVNPKTHTIYPLGYDKYTNQMYANKNFLVNCVNYLSGDQKLMQLRTREIKQRLLNKSNVEEERGFFTMLNTVGAIGIMIVFGVIYFYIRKRKYAS